MEQLSALRSRRNGERDARRHGGHVQRRAQYELRIGDEHFGVEILTIPLEPRIVGDVEDDVHVAALASTLRCVPDAAHRHVLPRRDSGGNRDLDHLLAAHSAVAPALLALGLDDLAVAVAGRARSDRDELTEEGALRSTHLALSGTRGALLGLAAWLRAAAMTAVAGVEHLERDLLLHTGRHLGEREWNGELHVGARARATRSLPSTEQILEAGEVSEVAHEDAERLGEIDVVIAATAAAQPRLAVPVVRGALLRIAQDVVRLRDLLELLLGFLRPVVPVGMVGHRKLAIGPFDVIVRRAAIDAKDAV